MQLRTETAFTSGGILDEVVLTAYENFDKKAKDISLEQWLYQLANRKLESYLGRASKQDDRRRSLESLAEKEESTLEERMTADAEGEVMLEHDLYDTEYQCSRNLLRPQQLRQIVRALSRIPEKERTIFELYAVEGKDEVTKIADVSPEIVPKIVEPVRAEVKRALQSGSKEAA